MSVGFGFSAGDLVAGLKVIKDSVEAVKGTKGASADYAALISEITSLQGGFEAIDDLQLRSRGSPKQQLAIARAIGACRTCVDDFLTSISKYQPHLQPQATGLISNFRKIRWALCKKEDVALFRAKLERHTSSINMLLLSLQAHGQVPAAGVQASSSLVWTPSDRTGQTLDMLQNLSADQRQWFEVLMQQNHDLMRNVQDLHRMLQIQMSIPPQVLLQQPVVLLDAFGKHAPFHLEFIDSLETFTAVLKIRFRKAGVKQSGLAKVDNREYTIQETRRRRPIDFEKPWSEVFQPGQEVDMSMVFHRLASPSTICPGCARNNENADEQIQCRVSHLQGSMAFDGQLLILCSELIFDSQGCGLCYQNINPSLVGGWPWLDPATALYSSKTIERLVHARGRFGPRVLSRVAASEEIIFDGYRRVQVIFTSVQTDSGSSHPFDAFPKFVGLFGGALEGRLPYLADMREMESRVQEYCQSQGDIPPLSLAETKRWHKRMAEEQSVLGHEMDQLMQTICSDERSSVLIKYIFRNHPNERTCPSSYTSLLINSLKNQGHYSKIDIDIDAEDTLTIRSKPHRRGKVKSKDQVQWMLLNSRGN